LVSIKDVLEKAMIGNIDIDNTVPDHIVNTIAELHYEVTKFLKDFKEI
jgi:hypothetical protein